MKKSIYIIGIILLCVQQMQAQQVTIHSNLAADVLMMPSVGMEMMTGNRTSLDLTLTGTVNPWGKKLRGIAVQPEFRYWLSGRPLYGAFVGVGATLDFYNIHWANKIYQGTAGGGGLTFGYAFKLAQHMSLTLHAGCGLVGYSQKEYYEGDNYNMNTYNGSVKTNAKGFYFLPTNAGVTFSYLFK